MPQGIKLRAQNPLFADLLETKEFNHPWLVSSPIYLVIHLFGFRRDLQELKSEISVRLFAVWVNILCKQGIEGKIWQRHKT